MNDNPPSIIFSYISEDSEFGEYFETTNIVRVYLPRHESIPQIFDTLEHEVLHKCIGGIMEDEIDIHQEHRMIFQTLWAKELL